MKKELADSLRHMQSHPTTGTPHNQQLISTQVETIFAVDELKGQIGRLIRTIEINERQSQKLEKSNISLQRTMLVLTFITTIIALFPALRFIFSNIISPLISYVLNISLTPDWLTILVTIIPAVLSVIISLLTSKYQKRFLDIIKVSDNINIVLRDKEGKIKEIRNQ